MTRLHTSSLPVRIFPKEPMPEGMFVDEKLFVMTDIHGSANAMHRLLSMRPRDARLVFLGDAIDRGNRSLEVLRYLDIESEKPDTILLKGNHDIMAWYACHGGTKVHTQKLKELWLEYNGGDRTVAEIFWEQKSKNLTLSEIRELAYSETIECPLFDSVFAKMRTFWQSGNAFFVHGGLAFNFEDKWLAKQDIDAVSMRRDVENHWSWYRPYNHQDGWCDIRQRKVRGKPVFLVCGHTYNEFDFIKHRYTLFMDTGYTLKTAAILHKNQMQLVATPCDEVREFSDSDLKLCMQGDFVFLN